MFKRLIFDTWDGIIPVAGLLLTFAVFIVFLVRAIRMKVGEIEHLSHLPLQDEPVTETHSANAHSDVH